MLISMKSNSLMLSIPSRQLMQSPSSALRAL